MRGALFDVLVEDRRWHNLYTWGGLLSHQKKERKKERKSIAKQQAMARASTPTMCLPSPALGSCTCGKWVVVSCGVVCCRVVSFRVVWCCLVSCRAVWCVNHYGGLYYSAHRPLGCPTLSTICTWLLRKYEEISGFCNGSSSFPCSSQKQCRQVNCFVNLKYRGTNVRD